MPIPSFNPNILLRNEHIQSILASSKIRYPWIRKRAHKLLADEVKIMTHGDDGVRLLSFYNNASPDAPLVVLLHGWEGSAHSQYILSCASLLLANGYSVCRLQLRDHGDSHHLNREVFHSCRLSETAEAVRQIALRFSPQHLFLGGFSLGGNFSLRVALIAPNINLTLDGVCAISPVIDPASTLTTMSFGPKIYQMYFMKKWRRSLRRKLQLYPNIIDGSVLQTHTNLFDLTKVLVESIPEFDSVEEYLDGYSVKDKRLESLNISSAILAAQDDPIVPDEPLLNMVAPDNMTVHRTKYGGHCGFIENLHSNSYADQFMLNFFDSSRMRG